jgi:L-ascorbate metabolism protein UlaG (beta-lactamase superfamily)
LFLLTVIFLNFNYMKITKFGHSCLLVEEGGARILLDPGSYSTIPKLDSIDAILITHEHSDHFDSVTLKKIMADNPGAPVYTNAVTGEKLATEHIIFTVLGDGQEIIVNGVKIEGIGVDHALIYQDIARVKNTGYLVAGRLYQPGDAYTIPKKAVEILALPIAAPWAKISDTLDYLKAVKPKIVFPIHDAFLKFRNHPYYKLPSQYAEKQSTKWIEIEDGVPIEV